MSISERELSSDDSYSDEVEAYPLDNKTFYGVDHILNSNQNQANNASSAIGQFLRAQTIKEGKMAQTKTLMSAVANDLKGRLAHRGLSSFTDAERRVSIVYQKNIQEQIQLEMRKKKAIERKLEKQSNFMNNVNLIDTEIDLDI